jgi:hypothetical protein
MHLRYLVVGIDVSGNLLWQNGGSGAGGIRATYKSYYGEYIVAGRTNSTDGDVSETMEILIAGL